MQDYGVEQGLQDAHELGEELLLLPAAEANLYGAVVVYVNEVWIDRNPLLIESNGGRLFEESDIHVGKGFKQVLDAGFSEGASDEFKPGLAHGEDLGYSTGGLVE